MGKKRKKQVTGNWYYRLELSKKTSLWGIIFLLPWLLGFLIFFTKPMIESIYYSFNTVKIMPYGGIDMVFTGMANYDYALKSDPTYNQLLISMVLSIPSILVVIIFSLLVSILVNGKFPGRSVARAIFFIPIIMSTNIAKAQLGGVDLATVDALGGDKPDFGAGLITGILEFTPFSSSMSEFVGSAVANIFSIIAVSGVPILIFLAALQSIQPSLYEVAKIEGATAYETFWKVTFPMVSPMVLICTIYSLADLFLRSPITDRMYQVAFTEANYGLSAAMTSIYLIVCIAIISIVALIMSRKVFYYD